MAKQANGDGSVFYDASKGVWVAQIDLGRDAKGRRVRRKLTGRTRKEAKQRLDAALAKRKAGLPVPDERTTVGAFLQQWIDRSVPGTSATGPWTPTGGRFACTSCRRSGRYHCSS